MFGKKIVLKIDGMSCEHCAKKVEEGLKNIESVKFAKVNLKNKNVTLKYSGSLDLNLVEKIVKELGYQYLGVE